MSRKEEEVSRLGAILWIYSLLRRHYRSYIVMLVSAIGAATLIHYLVPNYNASARIHLNSFGDSQLLSRLTKISGAQNYPIYSDRDDADKYLKLFQSQAFGEFMSSQLEKRMKTESLNSDPDVIKNKTLDILRSVSFKKGDYDRIDIHCTSRDPNKAMNYCIEVADYGKEAIIALELKEIAESEKYLKTEMERSQRRLGELSTAVETYKKEHSKGIYSLDDKSSPVEASIARLSEELEITKVNIDRNELLVKQFEEQIQSLKSETTGESRAPGATENILQSRGRLIDMVRSVREETKNLIANRTALETRLAELNRALEPGWQQKVYEFQKKIELEYSFFELLQQNLFESGIQAISVKNRVRSVDVPSILGVSEKLPLAAKLIFALVFATLTTIVLVALIEYFFPVVISKKDVLELGVTYLAHIPRLSLLSPFGGRFWLGSSKEKMIQVCAQNTESQGGISFRFLRVRFLQTVSKFTTIKKVFAVGSSRPNEGKSFVTANLAVSLSGVGQRVLLIDGDERVASLSKLFSDLTGDGLVQYCRGETTLDKIIMRGVYPNLDFLPVGYKTADEMADILASGKMREIIDQLRNQYDYILVDTPAFHAGADALMVYELADAPIFVMEASRTSIAEAHSVLEMLRTLGHERIFGVLNRYTEIFELTSKSYYYYVKKDNESRRGEAA